MQPGPHDRPGSRQLLQSWGPVAVRQGVHYQPWDVLGERLETCPLPMIPDYWPRLWSMHLAWEKGILPDAGGMRDQPAWFGRVMPAIACGLEAAREEKRRRESHG